MRPPAPAVYRRGGIGDGVSRWLDQPTRIILRQIGRFPLRAAFTSAAVACSVALVVMALQWTDAIHHLTDVYFFAAQRQSAVVGLVEAQSSTTLHEFARLPGVLAAEPMLTSSFPSGVKRSVRVECPPAGRSFTTTSPGAAAARWPVV